MEDRRLLSLVAPSVDDSAISTPDDSWDRWDNGTYTVTMQSGSEYLVGSPDDGTINISDEDVVYQPGIDPQPGFNLVSWWNIGGGGAAVWADAVQELYDNGYQSVSIVPVRYVDPATGVISGGQKSPEVAHLAAGIDRACSLGMTVTVNPLVEPQGFSTWRGNLQFTGDAATEFFNQYRSYLSEVAGVAEAHGATRMTIGSELKTLTDDPSHNSEWTSVIDAVAGVFGGLLGYAANWDEYGNANLTTTIWENPHINFLGVDLYPPLATQAEADASGAHPDPAFIATVAANWTAALNDLHGFAAALKSGSGMPVVLTEVGLIPYNLTTTKPNSNEFAASEPADSAEQVNGFTALLQATDQIASWLPEIYFWHWGMPGAEGSAWYVHPDDSLSDQAAQLLHDYVANPLPPAPEIVVEGLGQNIADGNATPSSTDGTDFQTVAQGGAAVTRTFTVRNTGTTTLSLGAPTLPAGFTIVEPLSGTIDPGGSDTFTVQLSTATVGMFAGDVSFSTDDGNENPFNFRIAGTVTIPLAIDSGQFFHNGEPVFLNVISYQPLEPGQPITDEIRETRIEDDLRRFEAYRNDNDIVALRVYAQPTAEYPVRMPKLFYDGVRDLGFWIIRDIYFDDFQGPDAVANGYQKIDAVINEVETVGGLDRIFAWEIGNEFQAADQSEKPVLEDFLTEMRDYVKTRMAEPSHQGFSNWVTWATWPPSDLLGTDGTPIAAPFDFYSINVYPYEPDRIRDHQPGPVTGTSYAGYLRALKEKLEETYPGTPLVISETGLPDSPNPVPMHELFHPWYSTYRKGGINGQPITEGLVDRYMDARLGGIASGMAIFEWNDEWWKSGDPNSHNGAEEYFGLGGFELVGVDTYQLHYKLQQEAIRDLFTLNFNPDSPVIVDLQADQASLSPGEDTTLQVTVSPGVSGPVRYRWESSAGRIVGDSDTVQFFAGGVALGPAEVTVLAIDALGNASTLSLTIDIQPSNGPLVEIFTRDWRASGRVANVDLQNYTLVCYAETDQQYLQPQNTWEAPFVPVGPDGYWWATDIYPGTLRAYVIPRGTAPPHPMPSGEEPPGTIASAAFDGLNDTDNNLLPDDWEQQYFGSLGQDRYGDPDGDQAYNLEECLASICPEQFIGGGNPTLPDNDQDGDLLHDNWEYLYLRTLTYGSDSDPDQDGLTNAQELDLGIHPGRTAPDSDQDNLPDLWEKRYFGNTSPGPEDDPDQDGKSNLLAYQLGVIPVAPEIVVEGLGQDIADGDTTPSLTDGTDFGTVFQDGTALTQTFTVQNAGMWVLNLGTPTLPAGFTLSEPLNETIDPSGSDTFTVQLSTATIGTFQGDVSFSTNDGDGGDGVENPFHFAIKGVVLSNDTTPPSVTINQAATQDDPTDMAPVHFTVVFSEEVTDFAAEDVQLSGSAPGASVESIGGSGTTYDVAIGGMTGSGTVRASIPAGGAHDAAGNPNEASASTDAVVVYLGSGSQVSGTEGDDFFQFHAEKDGNPWYVELNGQVLILASPASDFTLDGGGGEDTLEIFGNAEDDLFELWPHHGTFLVGALRFSAVAMESFLLEGEGGADTLELYSNEGSNAFEAGPGWIVNLGSSLTAHGMEKIRVESAGQDIAQLHVSPTDQDDTLYASPREVTLTGEGYENVFIGFQNVQVYGSPGGNDTAFFVGSDANDEFGVSWLGAVMKDYVTFDNSAWNFRHVQGTAGNGASDVVYFWLPGSPADFYAAAPRQGAVSSDYHDAQATGFYFTQCYGNQIGTVMLHGSDGDDYFTATELGAVVQGENFDSSAWTFDRIDLQGTPGGNDSGYFIGTDGDETFFAAPTWSHEMRFTKPGAFQRYAWNIPNVAVLSGGGIDSAELYGNPDSQDTFVGNLDTKVTRLSDAVFDYWTLDFTNVNVYANHGGDSATLYGTSGDDEVYNGPNGMTIGTANAPKVTYGAWNFSRVEAHAEDGYDRVMQHVDSLGDDIFEAQDNWHQLTYPAAVDYVFEGWDFEWIKVIGTLGNNKKSVTLPVGATILFEGPWSDL